MEIVTRLIDPPSGSRDREPIAQMRTFRTTPKSQVCALAKKGHRQEANLLNFGAGSHPLCPHVGQHLAPQ
jgi:hypothetical protein